MRVAIAGDWHGDIWVGTRALEDIRKLGVQRVLHLGDFGVGFYKRSLSPVLIDLDMEIWVTLGNHENYDLVRQLPVENGVATLDDRILLLPRGHAWEDDGVRFLSLGGASSIDRSQRRPGWSWWADELITQADVETAITSSPSGTDILLTHEAPEIAGVVEGFPFGYWPLEDEKTSLSQRKLVEQVWQGTKPYRTFHGHHHKRYDREVGYGQWIHGLADNNDPKNNWVILDGKELEHGRDNP